MRLLLKAVAVVIAWGCLTMSPAVVRAESKVTISGTHLCCGACVTAVKKALADIPGVTHEASQGDSKIVITASDDQVAQKAVDALAAAGFYGKVNSQTVKYKAIEIPEGKVKRLEVSGIHNCCGSCNRSIKEAIKSVTGVTTDTAKAKSSTFVVEGDFSAKELVDALQDSGFRVEVKK